MVVREITTKAIWEKAVSQFPEANFLHSWNWGQFHRDLGKRVVNTGFFEREKIIGIMLSIVEKAKRATYLTVPGGPLIDWQDNEAIVTFRNTIEDIAKANRCSFVRVRPQILQTDENQAIFAQLGFRRAPMHLHAELTHQLDLTKSEDELLANMRKTTRYEIKKAQKLGIQISTSKNPAEIDAFYQLQMHTAAQHKFIPFSRDFLKTQFKVFVADNQVVLYTASLKDKVLTQAMINFYGQEADYHYSASSAEGRKYPGSYLIQWQAIKEAKHRGLKRYNLWGVAPEGQKGHRFYGVSVFKRGFRGQDIHYLPARDLVINPVRYALNLLVEKSRKKARRV